MSQWSAFPRHYGLNFTKTYRTKAEGLTDPLNIKLPKPFVVLITGAGKGLGFNITLAYAQAGASGIIICSRTESDLESLTNQVKSLNPDCSVLSRVCDTTSNEQLATLAADVKEEFGRLDVAIANAGIISKYIYDEDGSNRRLPQGILHDSDFERVVDINLIGSYRVAKYFIPLLIATKDGPQSYIVITSLASHNTSSEITPIAYNVTKNALNRLVESIHGDHHDVDGINAFSLHPGAVLTPQTEYHTGDIWEHILIDDVGLCGGFCLWLTQERRNWLSGRYISANWDPQELEGMRSDIVEGDKLKSRMEV